VFEYSAEAAPKLVNPLYPATLSHRARVSLSHTPFSKPYNVEPTIIVWRNFFL